MKTIDKIPKEIIEMYSIEETKLFIMIHKPNPISLDNDLEIEIEEYAHSVEIQCPGKFIITLWKSMLITHVTIV